ncbi:MAG: insulinase family protein, partial [Deltaproteobacteria bacterium]|nr:insulinase family protein [Deltaproteobacteria bacterium]
MTTRSSAGVAARRRERWISRLNAGLPATGQVVHEASVAFGPELVVDCFALGNGLRVLVVEDHAAPVVA